MSKLSVIHENLLRSFRTGKTRSYEFRITQLKNLKRFVLENESALAEALAADLHRCEFEAIALEISSAVTELDHVIGNLQSWMQPTYTKIPAAFAPATSSIVHEPFGICLVIGAFNYPFVLSISPLVGAIAAGNVAILKPSEMSSATEKVLATILPKYLDANFYQVVCGDAAVSSELLSLRFDKIFFTGSTRVGKIVAKAAAEHLTPVSLELGGKSPTIVDKHVVNLDVVAKRIVWGKLVNAGQTCIAPDYVYCHESIYEKLLEAMKQKIGEFYGPDPQQSRDLSRIISQAHTDRLEGMLQDSQDCVYYGGQVNKAERYIQPTLLTNVKKDAKVMQEEIFGPLLPIFTYKDIEEVIDFVNTGEKPLTMYIFTNNTAFTKSICAKVPSGSVVVNDTLFQFANMFAPFGGVGHSGMGGYHGKFSFECFSQKRSILVRDGSALLDIPIRYPPYTDFGLNFFKFALKLPDVPVIGLPSFKDMLFVGLAAFALYEIFTRYVPT